MANRTLSTVIVPAAGKSQRFADAGIEGHKALIKFHWRNHHGTMFDHILRDLEKDHLIWIGVNGLDVFTVRDYVVDVGLTEGQADTVHRMLLKLNKNGPVLVLNCDAGFDYPLELFEQQCMSTGLAYGALVFPGNEERQYSYVDNYPLFLSAAEKNPISSWAMAGAYWFSSSKELASVFEHQFLNGTKHSGEFYLSGTFQMMRGPGLAVAMERKQLHVWGTPEDLARDPTVRITHNRLALILEKLK